MEELEIVQERLEVVKQNPTIHHTELLKNSEQLLNTAVDRIKLQLESARDDKQIEVHFAILEQLQQLMRQVQVAIDRDQELTTTLEKINLVQARLSVVGRFHAGPRKKLLNNLELLRDSQQMLLAIDMESCARLNVNPEELNATLASVWNEIDQYERYLCESNDDLSLRLAVELQAAEEEALQSIKKPELSDRIVGQILNPPKHPDTGKTVDGRRADPMQEQDPTPAPEKTLHARNDPALLQGLERSDRAPAHETLINDRSTVCSRLMLWTKQLVYMVPTDRDIKSLKQKFAAASSATVRLQLAYWLYLLYPSVNAFRDWLLNQLFRDTNSLPALWSLLWATVYSYEAADQLQNDSRVSRRFDRDYHLQRWFELALSSKDRSDDIAPAEVEMRLRHWNVTLNQMALRNLHSLSDGSFKAQLSRFLTLWPQNQTVELAFSIYESFYLLDDNPFAKFSEWLLALDTKSDLLLALLWATVATREQADKLSKVGSARYQQWLALQIQ